MKQYKVLLTCTKTVEVEAESRASAVEAALDKVNPFYDPTYDWYTQEVQEV